jgi:riboflavin transporter FmnP
MLAAVAYVVTYLLRIPIWSFLKYDPKDIVIVIAGFIYGPLSACLISAVVSLVEMITVSDTGPIGLVMNILSTCAFACTAAWINDRNRTKAGAVTGLAVGVAVMAAAMLLWNWLITPLYMEMERSVVAGCCCPSSCPSTAEGGLNMAFTLLLYKPVITALRRANLLPEADAGSGFRLSLGMVLLALAILVTIILIVLVSRTRFKWFYSFSSDKALIFRHTISESKNSEEQQ